MTLPAKESPSWPWPGYTNATQPWSRQMPSWDMGDIQAIRSRDLLCQQMPGYFNGYNMELPGLIHHPLTKYLHVWPYSEKTYVHMFVVITGIDWVANQSKLDKIAGTNMWIHCMINPNEFCWLHEYRPRHNCIIVSEKIYQWNQSSFTLYSQIYLIFRVQ